MSANSKQTLKLVAESVGKFIEYWGFKNIHGRIWTLVYLSKKPISTPEIVNDLEVSKGLVSIAINELLEHKLLLMSSKTTHGAQTYVATERIASVVKKILKDRELKLLTDAENALLKLESLNDSKLDDLNVSHEKLDQIIELNSAHRNLLRALIKKDIKDIKPWTKLINKASKLLKF